MRSPTLMDGPTTPTSMPTAKPTTRLCHRLDNDPLFDGSHFCGRTDDIRRAVMTLLKSRRGNIIFVGDAAWASPP